MCDPGPPSSVTTDCFCTTSYANSHHLRLGCGPHGFTAAATLQLSRNQFLSVFKQFLGTDVSNTTGFAHHLLHLFCTTHGIHWNRGSQYPSQPRPHDLVLHDLRYLQHCMATPKVDGQAQGRLTEGSVPANEAFMVLHAHGCTVLLRDGTALDWPMTGTLVPVILEGELLHDAFFVYDCLLSPVMAYADRGRYTTLPGQAGCVLSASPVTTHSGNASVAAPTPHGRSVPLETDIFKQDACICNRVLLSVALNPVQAMLSCKRWAVRMGVPCDGVVFIDDSRIDPWRNGFPVLRVLDTNRVDCSS